MMTNRSSTDKIGKLFIVRSHGLRECLVCGESFAQQTARAHAQVNCYPLVESCLMEPEGEKHVAH
jgi:hypothetical protein